MNTATACGNPFPPGLSEESKLQAVRPKTGLSSSEGYKMPRPYGCLAASFSQMPMRTAAPQWKVGPLARSLPATQRSL